MENPMKLTQEMIDIVDELCGMSNAFSLEVQDDLIKLATLMQDEQDKQPFNALNILFDAEYLAWHPMVLKEKMRDILEESNADQTISLWKKERIDIEQNPEKIKVLKEL
jgi:hypothetical protein|tara:strand:+ start:353 stop:679 length:327 start_codon:yes stop_codon:yes gene_type:complete